MTTSQPATQNGELMDATSFIAQLRQLREARRLRQRTEAKTGHQSLTRAERAEVAAKTGGRCHLCGGVLGLTWEADHVLAHGTGGRHQLDNYLPAHQLCNNYRWDYLPDEFQWVLKIGVWARLVMEKPLGKQMEKQLGQLMARKFCAYERGRVRRRKKTAGSVLSAFTRS